MYVNHGYTAEQPAREDVTRRMRSEAVNHHEVKLGFGLMPRRWSVERTFG